MSFFFFFNDTATTEIYTLSLHDAPSDLIRPRLIRKTWRNCARLCASLPSTCSDCGRKRVQTTTRSEEHTSELQSRQYLVCRLLLEKKKRTYKYDSVPN